MKTQTNSIPAVILAGGTSSRMGRDKALLPIAGIPMLHRIAHAALRVCPQLLIVGRKSPAGWPAKLPATFLPDRAHKKIEHQKSKIKSSAGPLLGLITALEYCKSPILLLPCDTPFVTPGLLRALLRAHTPTTLATMAATPEGPEPTLAIYTPQLLPILRKMLSEDRRALFPLAHSPGITLWQVPPHHRPKLFNVNDPAALAAANRAPLTSRAE